MVRLLSIFFLASFTKANILHEKLSDVISTYELAHITEQWLNDTTPPSFLGIKFSAFNSDLTINLKKQKYLLLQGFHSYLIHANGSRTLGSLNHDDLFIGSLSGWPDSSARFSRLGYGIWLGVVRWGKEELYVEPATFYDSNAKGWSVVYPSSAVSLPSTLHSLPLTVPFFQSPSSPAPLFLSAVRPRRAAEQTVARNRCSLKIVADHFFFEKIGHSNQAITTRYIAALIDRINSIFTSTDWGYDDKGNHLINLGFSIKKIVIHETPTNTFNHYNTKHSYFMQLNKETPWDVTNLHKIFMSTEGTRDYCLVLLFSAREISSGVKGESFVAQRYSGAGGICSDTIGNITHNTLFASFVDASRTSVTRQVDLIVAHELGHAWGATHDENDECTPGYEKGGLFIMHKYTISGYDSNNDKFSPCTVSMVNAVLQSKREECFEREQETKCGNGVLDEGEECDAPAFPLCCTPECKFTPTAACSPQHEPCCSNSCDFLPRDSLCSVAAPSLCLESSQCTGSSGACPSPPALSDGRDCLDGGECLNGTCMPFCESRGRGQKPCICLEPSLSCRRCCRSPSSDLCQVVEDAANLTDGTACVYGYCKNAYCVKEHQDDIIVHYFDVILGIDRSSLLPFIKTNIVGITVMISLIFWIPICLLVAARDRSLRQPRVFQSMRRTQYDRSIAKSYTPNVTYNVR